MGLERFFVNRTSTLLSSAVRAATATTAAQTNMTSKGVVVTLDITVVSGTGTDTLTLSVEYKDPTSGKWVAIGALSAYAASGGVATKVLEVYPNSGAAAQGITGVANRPLPAIWRAKVTHSGSGNWTYTLGAAYVS